MYAGSAHCGCGVGVVIRLGGVGEVVVVFAGAVHAVVVVCSLCFRYRLMSLRLCLCVV